MEVGSVGDTDLIIMEAASETQTRAVSRLLGEAPAEPITPRRKPTAAEVRDRRELLD